VIRDFFLKLFDYGDTTHYIIVKKGEENMLEEGKTIYRYMDNEWVAYFDVDEIFEGRAYGWCHVKEELELGDPNTSKPVDLLEELLKEKRYCIS